MISTEQHPEESEALFRLALDRTCPTARDKGAADLARVTGDRMHRGRLSAAPPEAQRRRARAAPSMPAGTFPEAVGRAGAWARTWADEGDLGLVRLVRATKLMLPSPDVRGRVPVRAEHGHMLTF